MDVNALIDSFNSIPTTAWYTLGAAFGASLLLQAVKHFVKRVLTDNQIISILTFLSGAASVLETVVVNLQANPLILGRNTAMVVGLATLLYRFPIKPVTLILSDAKAHREAQKASHAAPAVTTLDETATDKVELPEAALVPEKRPVGEYATF